MIKLAYFELFCASRTGRVSALEDDVGSLVHADRAAQLHLQLLQLLAQRLYLVLLL